MYSSTLEGGLEKALTRLREAHAVLTHLLERDETELEESSANTQAAERALRHANPHEDWTDRPSQT